MNVARSGPDLDTCRPWPAKPSVVDAPYPGI